METLQEQTTYDAARERRAQRHGSERGVRVYLSAAELRKAGIDPHGPAPTYKVWATSKGGLMLRLYTS